MSEYVLEVRNITKRFPGVLANDHISFGLKKGEIHAFLGENGAGKSTLMNVIYGLYDPDEGQIFLNGEEVKIENPHDAIARGIGMVHQHFMLVPVFTALENIVLGHETTIGPTLDLRSAREEVLKISEQYGLPIEPDMVIEDMPVGLQQRVEIIKALYRHADILVLDEPTAVLTPQEADELFEVMRSLEVSQMRAMSFVPQEGTPLQSWQEANPLREILILAILRLVFPDRLIPATLDVEGLSGLQARLDAGANVVTSLVPPGFGLAGVAQNSLDIADARRTMTSIAPELEKLGLQAASLEDYSSWIDDRRRQIQLSLSAEEVPC